MVQDIHACAPELEKKVNPEHKPDKVPTVGELVEADPGVADEFKLTPDSLAGWHLLVPSNGQRGDAQAVADAELGPDAKKIFKDAASYKILEAYDIGGKENEYPVPAHAVCTGANPFTTRRAVQRRLLASRRELVRHDVPHATPSTSRSSRCRR